MPTASTASLRSGTSSIPWCIRGTSPSPPKPGQQWEGGSWPACSSTFSPLCRPSSISAPKCVLPHPKSKSFVVNYSMSMERQTSWWLMQIGNKVELLYISLTLPYCNENSCRWKCRFNVVVVVGLNTDDFCLIKNWLSCKCHFIFEPKGSVALITHHGIQFQIISNLSRAEIKYFVIFKKSLEMAGFE